MHAVLFSYELSAYCRMVMYLLTAAIIAGWAWRARRRVDVFGALALLLLAGNALLGAQGAPRDLVGAVATPIAAVLCGYVLLRQH